MLPLAGCALRSGNRRCGSFHLWNGCTAAEVAQAAGTRSDQENWPVAAGRTKGLLRKRPETAQAVTGGRRSASLFLSRLCLTPRKRLTIFIQLETGKGHGELRATEWLCQAGQIRGQSFRVRKTRDNEQFDVWPTLPNRMCEVRSALPGHQMIRNQKINGHPFVQQLQRLFR